MRWARLTVLLSGLLGVLGKEQSMPSLPYAGSDDQNDDECKQPSAPIATVAMGSLYIANLPCVDCPISRSSRPTDDSKSTTPAAHNLLFNISLSLDARAILLNDHQIFPILATKPHPPDIIVARVPEHFSRADLDRTIECTHALCKRADGCECVQNLLSRTELDFDYLVRYRGSAEDGKEQWSVTFDALGGRDIVAGDTTLRFNSSEQDMLAVLVQGREIEGERYAGEKDLQAASSLFGNLQESEAIYEYEILEIDFAARSYVLEPTPALGFLGRLRRFFGTDMIRNDGHFVYLQEEWATYGKKGSLRNYIGVVVHDWPWEGILIILGSLIGGLVALLLAYKLLVMVKEQRKLARWDGMDNVWAQLRRPSEEEEEDQLLDGGYRDNFDEDPPGYTDEVQTNKPLPSKPLPEKPLPSVPLIDP